MDLVWEDPPIPDAPFFTRDIYDKYSLAPNIRELWASLQPTEENANIKQDCDVGAAKASSSPVVEAAEFKDKSCTIEEETNWNSCESDDPYADNSADGAEEYKDTKKSKVKLNQPVKEAGVAYPEPRLPFPCMSSLSSKDQKTYLTFLLSKKHRDLPQSLKERVNNEVMQFMRYLQDVAKICADDYNFLTQGALQYSEDFFKGCLECIKTFPQFYQIHEMTSLTGGTFNPGLMLNFEKQLLSMGNVDITDHKIVPADAQLASDYQSVSSENPPAKKAKDMHAAITSDANAEKLCSYYGPHVCLTRNALVRLLDNHGPDFGEQWELPVWVKINSGKGSSQKKTVYIDSPLLKTEMTVRERSHIYHEESLKLSIKKSGRKNVFHLMTELPASEKHLSLEKSQRNVVSFESNSLDFEVDLTDLETFGEMTPIKSSKLQKMQSEQDASVKGKNAPSSLPLNKSKRSSESLVNTSCSLDQMSATQTDMDDPVTEKTPQPILREPSVPKTEQMKPDTLQEIGEQLGSLGDSDDEKLVIDDSSSPAATQTKPKTTPCSSDTSLSPGSETFPINLKSSPRQKVTKRTRQSRVSGDQLSEILRMQTAMFNSVNDTAKCSPKSQETNLPAQCIVSSVQSHPTSLVKPCVSSYLEKNQDEDGDSGPALHRSAPAVNIISTECKKILSQELQAGAEDEQDYDAPEEGNLLYKLYSLQDFLLMVRSSVLLTHTRNVGSSQNQYVPVHVLPKLEYQLSYGVECLTSSEACQLWTETLLHSSTVSYIAHINAHTSKLALLRKLPDDWKQNISCGFKPSKSVNILHHLLKKLTGLDEGQYIIAHKAGEPFVTLLKAATGRASRSAYNLQQVHSSVPQPPLSGLVPWVPVDPAVVLPFHQEHSRVPCTFPPKSFLKTAREGSSQSNNHGCGQSKNAGGNMRNKRKKRAAKRNKYIKKLVQKSI
ncbi:little elongation complex subunit 2 [Mastacembelus armatus]|uniref:little elongation complex subunit 2 n=1 Tax=Mastacembelus armatus TaxID=205130 RepID=UPI000E461ACD|nr:little elongation complex subunit 2 [Mastacembelus armatus]